MSQSRRWRHWEGLVTAISAAFLTLVLVALSVSPALADTTGVISGTVTNSASGAPIAGVRVSASSPSGSYNATTNARGFYSMAGVYADTYTVSFQLDGYNPVSVTGTTVFADQVASVNEQLVASLKTIATVRARSESSAFQPNQTTNTVTVGATQIQQLQGTAFNFSETNLLTSLPGATKDSSGYPVIHGGREYEEGFEFEGIPYTDAYSNQFNNSLAVPTSGVSLVQLTAGAGDASQAGGGTGTFNIVAKRGTFPGYADVGVAAGSGIGFNHRLQADSSWATPDGRFSNYASFAGDNQAYKFGDGSIPDAQLGEFYNRRMDADREFIDNFVFRFGHDNSQSLQLFTDLAQHDFYQGNGGLHGLCFASCDATYKSTWAGIYGLTQAEVTAISALYPGQTSGNEFLTQASDRAPFTYFQPNQAFKIAYTNNFNSSTFFSAKFYRTNSVTIFDGPSTEGSYAGDLYLYQGGQTTGFTLSLQKQLNDANLFEAGVDISHLHPVDSYMSDSYGFYAELVGTADQNGIPYAFVNPNDPNCPLGPGGPSVGGCGYAYGPGVVSASAQLTNPQFDQVSTVQRQDYSFYVKDKMTINSKLNAEVGVRVDAATYRMPTPQVDPTYCTTQYIPTAWTANPNYNPAAAFGGANCPFNAKFDLPNNAVKPVVIQPRVALSYHLAPNTALRLTYDRGVQFVPIASVDFGEVDQGAYINTPWGHYAPNPGPFSGTTACGLPGFTVPCVNFGEQIYWANQNFDGTPYQPARPTTTDNYQFTLEQQFTKGILNGVALSVAPWYRYQHDTIASESSPILGPNGLPLTINGAIETGPPLLTNAGKEHGGGVDVNITRERPYGISAQVTMSYINEFSSVIPTSGSEDFYPTIVPASILAGNVYRVGFVSPFQSTFAFSYKTHSGWRINPRYSWDIGYPTGLGQLAPAIVNGVAVNVPNTNGLVGSAPNGPAYFIDPENPGSVFAPNIVAGRGNPEAASAGGKLSKPDSFTSLTIEYAPPKSALTYGFNVDNLFNEIYTGATLNARYQPIATGIAGPLTGYSTSSSNYLPTSSNPAAWPFYGSYMHGNQVYVDIPRGFQRSFYFYIQARL
ncbi:MAG TPA: TonB-dependent receptor [Candidatus Baltobacteraceae bacterium]